jgi:hypothetical protein
MNRSPSGLRFNPFDVWFKQTGIPAITTVALGGELAPCLCGDRNCAGVKIQLSRGLHFDRNGNASIVEATRPAPARPAPSAESTIPAPPEEPTS